MSRSILMSVFASLVFLAPLAARAESLEQYSQKCDAAVGATVPDFDCDAGTLVPDTHIRPDASTKYPDQDCDRPNVLNHECDPGSRFQLLVDTDSAAIVAHCRKQAAVDDGKYGDIAVIQYSKKNGATCFYQAGGNFDVRLDPKAKAPSKGAAAWSWREPPNTAAAHCGECHDNGPFIRTPYLNQLNVSGNKNILPGSDDSTYNDDQPYAWVGEDFKTWKAYSVKISGNTCNGCHRMGVSNMQFHDIPLHPVPGEGGGTARQFGIIATAKHQAHKNDNGPDSPIWMTPDAQKENPENQAAAKAIRACALKFVADKYKTANLPDGCTVKLFAKAYKP